MRSIKPYLSFSGAATKMMLTYRLQVFLWFIAEATKLILIFFLWHAIFSNSESSVINGYTYGGIVMYYLFAMIVGWLTFSDQLWNVADDVKKGTLAMKLIKPIGYVRTLLFQNIGAQVGAFFIVVLPLIITSIILNITFDVGITMNFLKLLFIIIVIFNALLINFYFDMIFAAILMKVTNSFGVFQLRNAIIRLLSGALLPITLMPALMQKIANYLPFVYTVFIPSEFIRRDFEFDFFIKHLLISYFWVIALICISMFIFKRAIKKAVILGG